MSASVSRAVNCKGPRPIFDMRECQWIRDVCFTPQERTCSGAPSMSIKCQDQTSDSQLYAATSRSIMTAA
jgi:hypothetical protein